MLPRAPEAKTTEARHKVNAPRTPPLIRNKRARLANWWASRFH
jgi:hypothetical protein